MSVNFDSYKVFYIVAKNKSITSAAKELFVTQPTVTHSIQKLEEELGCILFIRGKRGVELTPEGKILYENISIACEKIWQAESDIKKLKEFQKGEISVGASETTLHHFLFPYLKKYKNKYPKIRLKIYNSRTLDMLNLIRENKLDCGILVFPFDFKEEGLKIKDLKVFEDVAIVGEQYKKLSDKKVSLKKLLDYPIISLKNGSITDIALKSFFEEHELEMNPDIELATADLVVPMVANDLGIGFVPEDFAKDALMKNEIYEVKLVEKLPRKRICLVYKRDKPKSIAVDAFIKCVEEDI